MKVLTSAYYLDYVNNFLTVSRFAEYYDMTIDQASSIIARSKVIWLSEDARNRSYFTGNCLNLSSRLQCMSTHNALVFKQRDDKRLLAEHSA